MNETPTAATDSIGDSPNPSLATSAPNELRFHWITRLGLTYTGIVLPLICFSLCTLIGGSPFDPDWQDGRTKTYAELLITGAAIGPFVPMLFFSMVSMGVLLWRPMHFVNVVWVRFGIYSGVLLAAQYCGIFAVALDGMPISMIGYSVLATGLLWSFGEISILCLNPRRPKVQIAYWIVIGLLFFLSLFGYAALYFFVPLFFAAPWALAAYLHMSIRLFRHGTDPMWRFSLARCLGIMTWLGVWFAAWRLSVMVMLEKYKQLPTHPPQNCYVATAAARGHARFVGSALYASQDGTRVAVNAQLRYLKAAELMLLCAAPRAHCQLRRLYDLIGPRIAARISHPLLADAAYISLKPAEWGAQGAALLLLSKQCRQWLRRGDVLE